MTGDDALGIPPAKVLDAVFLLATQERLGAVLSDARREASSLRRDICALTTEPELPANFQAAYGRIVSLLAAIENAVTNGKGECDALAEEFLSSDLCRWDHRHPEPSPGLVEAAKETIRKINEAEVRLIGAIKSAKSAQANYAEQGLIDWSMSYDCEFAVVIDPGPSRRFYDTCGEGEEPMLIRLSPPRDPSNESSFNDRGYNWNILAGMEDHPLRHGHHGYLVHCIIDHSPMPWQLLPCIQEIEVKFVFTDCETMPIRSRVNL